MIADEELISNLIESSTESVSNNYVLQLLLNLKQHITTSTSYIAKMEMPFSYVGQFVDDMLESGLPKFDDFLSDDVEIIEGTLQKDDLVLVQQFKSDKSKTYVWFPKDYGWVRTRFNTKLYEAEEYFNASYREDVESIDRTREINEIRRLVNGRFKYPTCVVAPKFNARHTVQVYDTNGKNNYIYVVVDIYVPRLNGRSSADLHYISNSFFKPFSEAIEDLLLSSTVELTLTVHYNYNVTYAFNKFNKRVYFEELAFTDDDIGAYFSDSYSNSYLISG